MALIVETGAGVADANAYIDEDYFEEYAETMGYDISDFDGDKIEAAIARATTWLDANYRSLFPGVRSFGTGQGLLWPRKAGSFEFGVFVPDAWMTKVVDVEGVEIENNAIPTAVKRANAEAAYRELKKPGALAPDLARGGSIKRVKAGSVEVEYNGTAPAATTFTVIDGILAGILIGVDEGSGYTARAVRV